MTTTWTTLTTRWSSGIFLAAAVAALPARCVADVTFQSTSKQVALIELYTSEGCSSCPPAEAWLGALRTDAGLWTNFVPLAFHVNYWDRLGWPDKFASKAFTARQYAYAAAWSAGNVYTPCFVRDGRECRDKDVRREERAVTEAGVLVLRCDDAGRCAVSFESAGVKRSGLKINVALLGSGVVSNVKAGENAGRDLRHEFVVLALTQAALSADAEGIWRTEVSLPSSAIAGVPRRAVAAWVTSRDELAPIQATGGWLESTTGRVEGED